MRWRWVLFPYRRDARKETTATREENARKAPGFLSKKRENRSDNSERLRWLAMKEETALCRQHCMCAGSFEV